ncbi:MAG TPA: hypothetical protein VE978_23515 [Chitinophagales bacterium]|nr:hypothetical protein [Chitinophagales bacterium]
MIFQRLILIIYITGWSIVNAQSKKQIDAPFYNGDSTLSLNTLPYYKSHGKLMKQLGLSSLETSSALLSLRIISGNQLVELTKTEQGIQGKVVVFVNKIINEKNRKKVLIKKEYHLDSILSNSLFAALHQFDIFSFRDQTKIEEYPSISDGYRFIIEASTPFLYKYLHLSTPEKDYDTIPEVRYSLMIMDSIEEYTHWTKLRIGFIDSLPCAHYTFGMMELTCSQPFRLHISKSFSDSIEIISWKGPDSKSKFEIELPKSKYVANTTKNYERKFHIFDDRNFGVAIVDDSDSTFSEGNLYATWKQSSDTTQTINLSVPEKQEYYGVGKNGECWGYIFDGRYLIYFRGIDCLNKQKMRTAIQSFKVIP